MKKIQFVTIVMSLFMFCHAQADPGPVRVVASILPQDFFIQKIGKDRVETTIMVEPGANPHSYEPSPARMKAVADADIYFTIGVEFEKKWLKRFSSLNPKMKVFPMEKGIEKRAMASHPLEKRKHEYEKHGHHHHGESLDPHVWLSPVPAKELAKNTAEALISVDPENRNFYLANQEKLLKNIEKLHQKIKGILKDHKGESFMVFHPSWGYFAHTYGLHQIPVEVEGKSPKPAYMKELIRYGKQNNIRFIFVEPQFSKRSARMIADEIGASLITIDPLSEQWMKNMETIARNMKKAFQQK